MEPQACPLHHATLRLGVRGVWDTRSVVMDFGNCLSRHWGQAFLFLFLLPSHSLLFTHKSGAHGSQTNTNASTSRLLRYPTSTLTIPRQRSSPAPVPCFSRSRLHQPSIAPSITSTAHALQPEPMSYSLHFSPGIYICHNAWHVKPE